MSGRCQHSQRGFSLIEVILAISISVVILVVAIYFYHQTSNLRRQLIEETDKLTTIRLLFQKIGSDLRALEGSGAYSFIGNSNSVSFVINENRLLGRWTAPPNGASWPAGLYQVTYQMNEGIEGTNVVMMGLVRDERAVDGPMPSLPPAEEGSETNIVTGLSEFADTNLFAASTNELQSPITQLVRRLEFQYWTGSEWTNLWNDFTPPMGVQILLSADPAPDSLEAPEGQEGANNMTGVFRRTLYIPIGGQRKTSTNALSAEVALR